MKKNNVMSYVTVALSIAVLIVSVSFYKAKISYDKEMSNVSKSHKDEIDKANHDRDTYLNARDTAISLKKDLLEKNQELVLLVEELRTGIMDLSTELDERTELDSTEQSCLEIKRQLDNEIKHRLFFHIKCEPKPRSSSPYSPEEKVWKEKYGMKRN